MSDHAPASPAPELPIRLDRITASEIIALSRRVARLAVGAPNRQAAANRIIAALFDTFRDEHGQPALVLARLFETCSYARMPLDYRDAADVLLAHTRSLPEMRCLALLATRGIRSLWNTPTTSIGHKAIPLPSVDFVHQAPMIASLLDQMGLPVEAFVARDAVPEVLSARRAFNVFFVDQAQGSPFIPAQSQFVEAFGVRSVVGFGGELGPGEYFAVILFTRVTLSREQAVLFRPLARRIQALLRPFPPDRLFGDETWG